ncbi:hypothetical protein [Youxingia wuxianensis]|uniref:Uncharacterized protein n=1 Tax=Youxingia wuxianensis TaxID=2763678 RepID=A0A926EPE8_9FIRM|nr:hypothetical protein [Youxingia wuxianensis]MBC8584134.1 hypothetical protein [Youxingia wuxianensis]
MLRKLMIYLMMLATALRFFSLSFSLILDVERLPIPVVVSVAAMIIIGAMLILRNVRTPLGKKELTTYYPLASVSVLFNLLFIKFFSPIEVSALDLCVIGTMLDVVVNTALTLMLLKESRYVMVEVSADN